VTSAEIEQTKGTVPEVKKLNMPEPAKTSAKQTLTPITGAKQAQAPSATKAAQEGAQKLKTPEEKVSKVYSNTLKKTKMMTDAEKEMLDAKDFKYDVKSEMESIAEAQKRLADDFEGEVKKLSEKESFTGADVDTMFGILEKNLDDARKTGDYTEVNNILKSVRKGGTESGRGVQAFAKYSRTTEGKLAEAQRVVDTVEGNIKKTNPNLSSKIDDEITELTKKTEKTPKVTKKEEIRVWLDSKESEATQRIREYFNPDKSGVIKMRAGLPGEVLTDLAIVGATKLAKATLDFTDWSAEMIKEFGEKVKPHLEEVYNASKRVLKGGSSNLPKPKTVKDIGKYTSPEDIVNLVKKKYGLPVIDNDDIKYIVETMEKSKSFPEGSYNQRMLQAKVEQRIANKIPSTFLEKFQAAQRISMLLNPKTALVRNPVGNVLLGTMESIKNIPGAAIDTVVSAVRKSERTTKLAPIAKGKAALKGFGKGLKEWAQDIKNNVDTSPVGGQAEMPKKKIFNESAKNPVIKTVNKAANFTHSIVGRMLKVGDSPFYNGAYNSRIAELKKIKGTKEITEAMKEDAHLFALERTFQNDSGMSALFTGIKSANFLNKHPEAKFVYQFFANLILPFAKTPANILDKFIDYSPVGTLKAIGHGIATKGKGTFNQKKFVDTMARSLTGTGLIAAGYMMAKNGLITGARDTSNKVENIETALGKQNYAFKIGDTYRTFDWALPAAAPFAMGADIYNAVAKTKEGQNAALKGTESAVNLLFKSTLLQSPARMMSGYSPAASIGSTLLGSTTQFTPTVGKQIAQLRDPYQRETYDPNWVTQVLNKTKARIPGLSETLPAKVDVFGKDIKAFQGKNNVWNVLFNPGYSTEFKPSKEQKEIIRLYEDTGETGHIPIAAEKYISATKEHPKITLTAQEYVDYQKKIAKYTFNGWSAKGKLKSSTGFNGVINSDAYKNAKTDSKSTADEKRVSMLSKIIENAKKQAKEEILEKRGY
jgi:polyhydroxyalkanoate synthesis regulator phasin